MSRTYKDMPMAVRIYQGRAPKGNGTVIEDHACLEHPDLNLYGAPTHSTYIVVDDSIPAVSPHGRRVRWLKPKTRRVECNIDDFTYRPDYISANRDGHPQCLRYIHWFYWYDQGPRGDEVKLKYNKPLRQRERAWTTRAAKEYNSGDPDAGWDETDLPPHRRGPGLEGGNYWD